MTSPSEHLASEQSDTPKTDAVVWYAELDSIPEIPVVDASFARAQERRITELAEALRHIERCAPAGSHLERVAREALVQP